MNKLLKIAIILVILVSIGVNVYAVTPTLEQIADAFNNCSTVKEYADAGSVWKATTNGNKLTISVTANGETVNIDYTLNDVILSTNLLGDDALTGFIITEVLTDSIGQLHGYSDGELFATLNSDTIKSYTVENEGFEVKETSDKNYQIKIDISKKIPLIDVSDVYIEVSDLQDLKSFIAGDGSAEQGKGNVWFNKSGYDGENTLLVAEKDKLTSNTYNSILSIIEVMFDSKNAVNYFRTNYSGIYDGNKEFSGFKIEINPTKTEFEEKLIPSDSKYEFARITIDKNAVNSAMKGINNTENKEKDEEESKANNSYEKAQNNIVFPGELPQAGKNTNILIASVIITLIAVVFYKKHNNYKDAD